MWRLLADRGITLRASVTFAVYRIHTQLQTTRCTAYYYVHKLDAENTTDLILYLPALQIFC